jgi:hypothetical protein
MHALWIVICLCGSYVPEVQSVHALGGGRVQVGGGCGVLVGRRPDGAAIVLTARHVLGGAERARVAMGDGRRVWATEFRHAESTGEPCPRCGKVHGGPDISMLFVPGFAPAAPVTPIASLPPARGDPVTLIGRTSGRRSGRVIASVGGGFRVDTPSRPGDSGGPALDRRGRVIGVVSASDFHSFTIVSSVQPLAAYLAPSAADPIQNPKSKIQNPTVVLIAPSWFRCPACERLKARLESLKRRGLLDYRVRHVGPESGYPSFPRAQYKGRVFGPREIDALLRRLGMPPSGADRVPEKKAA